MAGTKKHKDVGSRSVPLLSSTPVAPFFACPSLMAGTDDRESQLEKPDTDKLPSIFTLLIQAKWQGQKSKDFGKKSRFPSTLIAAYPTSNLAGTSNRRNGQKNKCNKGDNGRDMMSASHDINWLVLLIDLWFADLVAKNHNEMKHWGGMSDASECNAWYQKTIFALNGWYIANIL